MDTLELKSFTVSRGFTYRYWTSPASANKDSSKPALFIQHGWPDTAHLFARMVPLLNSLPNRLIIPDLLGYGGTSKPTAYKEYAFNLMTQDFCDILDNEDVEKCVSVGHDWGAASAQRFYNFHPERVAGLVLMNVAYLAPDKANPPNLDAMNEMTKSIYGFGLYEYWYTFLAPDAPQLFMNNLERVWELMQAAMEEDMKRLCVREGVRQYLTDHSVPTPELKPYAHDPELKASWIQRMKESGFDSSFCWYHSFVTTESKDDKPVQFLSDQQIKDENITVNVPVLFVGCTGDVVARPEMINMGKDAGLLPDLKVETLDCAHWSPLEKPEEMSEAIKRFLEEKAL